MPEAQMASRQAAGFFGVILEVSLHILVGIVTDDFAGILVGADRAVGAETPEFAGNNALSRSHDVFADRQGQVRYIIVDADGEVVPLFAGHVVKDCFDLCRRRILGGEAVTAAQQGHPAAGLQQCGADVLIKRLTQCAGFLGAIQRRQNPAACRKRGKQMLHGKRPVQMHLNHADLFSLFVEIVHHFACSFTD